MRCKARVKLLSSISRRMTIVGGCLAISSMSSEQQKSKLSTNITIDGPFGPSLLSSNYYYYNYFFPAINFQSQRLLPKKTGFFLFLAHLRSIIILNKEIRFWVCCSLLIFKEGFFIFSFFPYFLFQYESWIPVDFLGSLSSSSLSVSSRICEQ